VPEKTTEKTPENLTRALVDRHLAERGDAIAVREPKRQWSYRKLADEAERIGAGLAGLGVAPGDRVALLMHDSLELVACFIGAARIGALPTPLSTLLRLHDLRAILADARPRVALVHGDLVALADEVCEELPAPPQVVAVPFGGSGGGEHSELSDLLAEAGKCDVHDGDGPAFLLYSGGGSGAPKGVPHDARAIEASFEAYARRVLHLSPDDRVFSTARCYTAYGLGCGLLFPLLAGATTVMLPERTRPRTVFETMAQLKPTVFAAAPSLYAQMMHDLVELTAPRPMPFATVRAAISGAEPLGAELWRRIKDAFGVEMLHGFGSTEALHFFLSFRPGEIKPGASGKLLDGYEARILDEQGRPAGVEEIGALEIRGPSLARGYWRPSGISGVKRAPSPEAAPQVFREGGWLHTGDRFFVDGEGWYYHCGRVDDLFKVSGKWVAPAEVEDTLLQHPAVWEAAVVGAEDADGLTIPVAFVVTNVGYEPNDALGRELMEFVKNEIAPYKYPRRVEFVAELPKSAQGKVQRWRLRLPTK